MIEAILVLGALLTSVVVLYVVVGVIFFEDHDL